MTDLWHWLMHIPEYLGEFGGWLTTPVYDGWPSPLAMVGVSAVVAVGLIVGFKIYQLIKPW